MSLFGQIPAHPTLPRHPTPFAPSTDGIVGKLLLSNIPTTKIPKVVSKPIIFLSNYCLMGFCISCYMKKIKKTLLDVLPQNALFYTFIAHIPFSLRGAGLNDTLVEQMKTIRTSKSETA